MTASKLSDGRRPAAKLFFALLLGFARLSPMTSAGGSNVAGLRIWLVASFNVVDRDHT